MKIKNYIKTGYVHMSVGRGMSLLFDFLKGLITLARITCSKIYLSVTRAVNPLVFYYFKDRQQFFISEMVVL